MMSLASTASTTQHDKVLGKKRPHSEISHANPLHVVGYKIFKNAIEIPDEILAELPKFEHGGAIFNQNETNKTDHKRRQQTISASKSSKQMKEFIAAINSFLAENISKTLEPNTWVVIHSKPGCQEQAAHCDYVPDPSLATASDEQMPLSAIVALMDGTKLNVWPNSIRLASMNEDLLAKVKPVRCQVIKMNKGDTLIFRGDLVHAGSSYDEANSRLHAFMDSDHVPRTANRTWIIHKHGNDAIKKIIVPKS